MEPTFLNKLLFTKYMAKEMWEDRGQKRCGKTGRDGESKHLMFGEGKEKFTRCSYLYIYIYIHAPFLFQVLHMVVVHM
jgi:hypothetical protein